ncbi:transglutaminaseTgpA domain-containing protein [Peribacillus sp. B-H-3]|uniref:transglutaminaseTgpA domain-containing protein n=1 Tax=Peribacillus sp. B-H-3 TaxID=3400420 RepID=UPI003B018DA5
MRHNSRLENFTHLLLYAFGILLLWEWLRPVDELTNTDNISIFILFAGLSLLLHYFKTHILLRFTILIAYIAAALHYFYSNVPFFDPSWVFGYIAEFYRSITIVFHADWQMLSDPFRTFLLFILLWLVTYLIHYWVMARNSIFLFFFVTIVFLAVADTFTPYDAKNSIVRLIIIGFVMLGLLRLIRLTGREKLRLSGTSVKRWTGALAAMVAISACMGFALPKFKPQWPDPVPFIVSHSNKAGADGAGGPHKVGYGKNDSRLGGTVKEDDSVVFYNDAQSSHYWKVENKYFYTGKGWEDQKKIGDVTMFVNDKVLDTPVPVNKKKIQHVHISVKETHEHVLMPEASYVLKVNAPDGVIYRHYTSKDRVEAVNEKGKKLYLDEYDEEYIPRNYDIQKLRKAVFPAGYYMDEMQLPDSFPEKIRDLAISITKNKTTLYDKVKAIEDYFDRPEFTYDKQNIPYPAENQDYVEQFLFETKRGYCDNFSTAMTVMVRSIGIPARWAKGYTEGTVEQYKGKSQFKVTNDNAHSWVEVLIPGSGWVPFEPTKGFSQSTSFYDSAVLKTQNDKQEVTPQAKAKAAQKTPPKQDLLREDSPSKTAVQKESWLKNYSKIAWAAAAIVLAVLVTAVLTWRKWLPHLLILVYRRKAGGETFAHAYHVLLKQLDRSGVKRPAGQTLREYAAYVDFVYGTDAMKIMTERYEKLAYRGDRDAGDFGEYQELWEKLIKKTAS